MGTGRNAASQPPGRWASSLAEIYAMGMVGIVAWQGFAGSGEGPRRGADGRRPDGVHRAKCRLAADCVVGFDDVVEGVSVDSGEAPPGGVLEAGRGETVDVAEPSAAGLVEQC